MMKYLFLILAINFAQLDQAFTRSTNYATLNDELVQLLEKAESPAEKAGLYWRISRNYLLQGQQEAKRDAKRACFGEGMRYAGLAIRENPKDPQGYMWHCANVGRDCQTRSVMEQASAVPKMSADLTMILDKLGRTDCSEAWQALSEIWWAHPFKSSDAAVNFARKAALTIPKGELRITTLTRLADLLYQRNWSAEKRAAAATENSKKYTAGAKSNIDKYVFFDGAPASELSSPWTTSPLADLSDRDEARAIAAYAQRIYRAFPNPSPIEQQDYRILLKLLTSWQ